MIGFDSTFIIDFLRGEPGALAKGRALEGEVLVVTTLNLFEVSLGAFLGKKGGERAVHEFFERTELLPITREAAVQAARLEAELIQSGKQIEVTDALSAAAYLVHGCTKVVTRDNAFARIKGLEVVPY